MSRAPGRVAAEPRAFPMPRAKAAVAPRARLAAAYVEPMKALGVAALPAGRWRTEIKFDGYRALAVLRGKTVELWSRNEKSLAASYPEVVAALGRLRVREAILDGEIVALDPGGRSRFQLLQQRGMTRQRPPIRFYLFDLLQHDGVRWTDRPIEERRAELEAVVGKGDDVLRLSPVFLTDPAEVLETARQQGLEGVVLKQPGSLYEPGRRSGAWLKRRISADQEFVIGGYTPPRGGRHFIGALLVGYYEKGKLRYAGKVGTGFDAKLLESLHRKFAAYRAEASAFSDLPHGPSRWGAGMTPAVMRTVQWLQPQLVAQVRFSEWTEDGLLRQPVFLGLREDKRASEVVREIAPSPGGDLGK